MAVILISQWGIVYDNFLKVIYPVGVDVSICSFSIPITKDMKLDIFQRKRFI